MRWWDQEWPECDQTNQIKLGQDYKNKIKTKTGEVLIEPLPSECMSAEIMWQTTASASIKLCESDNDASLSPQNID